MESTALVYKIDFGLLTLICDRQTLIQAVMSQVCWPWDRLGRMCVTADAAADPDADAADAVYKCQGTERLHRNRGSS